MKSFIFSLGFGLLFVFGMVWILSTGAVKNEKYECQTWKIQKQTIQAWTPADWQVEQCKQYGIQL